MDLSFIQWNCRGIYRKINELKNYLGNAETLPDIIALQETHLVPKYKPKINGYEMVRKDRDIKGGGICIFIKNEIPFIEIDLGDVSPIEAQCIRIQETYFFNVYIPPNKNVERHRIMSMLDVREPRAVKKVIVGDFNAHHPMWGSAITNSRGRHVFNTNTIPYNQ